MENAQLIGLSRQAALRRQLDVIANNLANMNTTGFKGETLLFQEYLMPVAQASAFEGDDQTLSYVQDGRPLNDLSAGSIATTGNPLDVAIDGDAWFVVGTADGERYTRDGAFTLGPDGSLVTSEGDGVLGEAGPILFTPGETDIHIAGDGTISTSEGVKGKLRLVRFDDADSLVRDGSGLYSGGTAQPATNGKVLQGALEQSNVRSVLEMSRMVEVTRAYTSLAKTLADSDELGLTAINQLGQLNA
jgi:flagellar basal-body rod protein FlgF